MILTEEEAKTKRCQESFPAADALSPDGSVEAVPMAMQTVNNPYGAMGGGHASLTSMSFARHTAPTHCIGSACMAWRWRVLSGDAVIRTNNDMYSQGYCGKAGKP